VKTTKAQHYGK